MPPKKKKKDEKSSKKEKTVKKTVKKVAKKSAKKPSKKKASKNKKSPVAQIDIPTAAYLNYLERMNKGLPGDETTDWLKAEKAAR